MSGDRPEQLGVLQSLFRYPVKSLTGQSLDRVEVERRGVVGDRLWSVRDPDGKLGSGKSSRRFRKMDGLLALAASYDGDVPVIEFPDGGRHRGDDPTVDELLSTHVGRPVRLAREDDVPHFDEGPIHLVTSATLAALADAHGSAVDVRRFRPNLQVDNPDAEGFVELEWVGRRIGVGDDVVLQVVARMPRCVMLNLAQRDLARDPHLLSTATRVSDADVGVLAEVVVPGSIGVGDPVRFVD